MKKKLIYLHGLSSSGESCTSKRLQILLPDFEIISPDIPINPYDALTYLRDLCDKVKPDLLIGTSMGGMFAQQIRGYRKILVNPSFYVSLTLWNNEGRTLPFYSKRKDGATEFDVTQTLCRQYEMMEFRQFDGFEQDRDKTIALFGVNDSVVDCKDIYLRYYTDIDFFDGGHRIDVATLECVIVPRILRMCNELK